MSEFNSGKNNYPFKVKSVEVLKAKHRTIVNYLDVNSHSHNSFAREIVKNTHMLYQFSPQDIHLIVFLDTEDLFDQHYKLIKPNKLQSNTLGGKS